MNNASLTERRWSCEQISRELHQRTVSAPTLRTIFSTSCSPVKETTTAFESTWEIFFKRHVSGQNEMNEFKRGEATFKTPFFCHSHVVTKPVVSSWKNWGAWLPGLLILNGPRKIPVFQEKIWPRRNFPQGVFKPGKTPSATVVASTRFDHNQHFRPQLLAHVASSRIHNTHKLQWALPDSVSWVVKYRWQSACSAMQRCRFLWFCVGIMCFRASSVRLPRRTHREWPLRLTKSWI